MIKTENVKKGLNFLLMIFFCSSCLFSQDTQYFQYEEGIASRNRGEYDRALMHFNAFIEESPKAKPDAYYHRAYVYLYQKNFSKAIEDFQTFQTLDPTNPEAYYMLGRSHQMINQYQTAIDYFDKTLEIDPRFARAYNDRGWMYCLQKKFDIALENFEQATAIDPDFAMAYNNAGAARYFNQDIAKPNDRDIRIATDWFSKAIEKEPTLGLAYRNRAAMYIFQKNYPAAVKDLTKAANLTPDDAMIPFYSGVIAADLNHKEEAMDLFGKASQLDPTMPFTHEEVGNLFKANSIFEEAIGAYYRAQQQQSGGLYAGLMDYKIAQVHAENRQEKPMYEALKRACKAEVFRDVSAARDLQSAKEFDEYRKDKKFKRLMTKVRKFKKTNKFLGPDLGWFRIRK